MNGTENGGINLVLIGGLLVFVIVICAIIGGAVWLYGRQSARRMKKQQEKE